MLITISRYFICKHNHFYKNINIWRSMLTIFSKKKANNRKARMFHDSIAKNILFLSIYLLNKSSACIYVELRLQELFECQKLFSSKLRNLSSRLFTKNVNSKFVMKYLVRLPILHSIHLLIIIFPFYILKNELKTR